MRDVIRLAFLGILGAGLVLPQVISAQTAKPRSSAANAGGALVNGDWAYAGPDAGGGGLSPGGHFRTPRFCATQRNRNHADSGRRHFIPHYSFQSRDRAGPRNRKRKMDL